MMDNRNCANVARLVPRRNLSNLYIHRYKHSRVLYCNPRRNRCSLAADIVAAVEGKAFVAVDNNLEIVFRI